MSAETTSITSTTALQSTIDTIKREARALTVKSADDYVAVGLFLTRLRNIKKQIGYLLDPGIQSAQAHVNELREGKARYIRQVDEIDNLAARPAEEWKRQEREAARREQDRVNEERRKAAEAQAEADRKKREAEIRAAQKAGDVGKREAERLKQQAANDAEAAKQIEDVTVQPNVPKVAGIRARVNWRFRIVDQTKIPRGFLMPNEQEIGKMVRGWKDKAKAEAECPGIEVWSEDAI